MGRILSLLKAAAGEISLSSKLGQWAQALSAEADQGVAAVVAASANQDTFSCPSTVSVNDLVYVSGTNTVDRANGAGTTAIPAIGFVISKPTATSCVVQYSGLLPNVFVGLTPGGVYTLGKTPGALGPPGTLYGPGTTVQQVGIAKSSTKMIAVIGEAVAQ